MVHTEQRPAALETIRALVERVEARLDTLGDQLVANYLSEIVDYRALDGQTLRADVLPTAQRNVQELLTAVREDTSLTESALEALRRSAQRRVHQGVPVQALLHAYRLWGRVVWQEFMGVADRGTPGEQDAVIEVASRIMAYVDQVSVAVAQTYLDEVSGILGDREAVRRDLLEALVSQRPVSERMRQRARASALDVEGAHAVVLARAVEPVGDDRSVLRDALVRARDYLSPRESSVLVGIREDEVVAIYPTSGSAEYRSLVAQAEEYAARLGQFAVGVGRSHTGVDGVAPSYAEAAEAVRLGTAAGGAGHAVTFSDVLLDHLLSNNPRLGVLHEETMRPLHRYDQARKAQLVRTLRVYYHQGFNLARSAAQLAVNPNTVVYRLKRIHELTGHDPHDPDQLLLLLLGMKSDQWSEE